MKSCRSTPAAKEAVARYKALHDGLAPAGVDCVPWPPPKPRYFVEFGRRPEEWYEKEVKENGVVHSPPYRHPYGEGAMPTTVHDDRGQLWTFGGEYTVTSHGIEDRPMRSIPYARSSQSRENHFYGRPRANAMQGPYGSQSPGYPPGGGVPHPPPSSVHYGAPPARSAYSHGAESYAPSRAPARVADDGDYTRTNFVWDAGIVAATAFGLTLGGALILQQTGWSSAGKATLVGIGGVGTGALIADNSPRIATGLIAGGGVNLLQALFSVLVARVPQPNANVNASLTSQVSPSLPQQQQPAGMVLR